MWTHLHSHLTVAKNKTPPVPFQVYVAAPGAVLTFESSFRTNPVALFTWVQGEGWGCHGNSRESEMSRGREGQRRIIGIMIVVFLPSFPLNTVTLSFTPPLFYGLSLSLLKSGLQDFTPAQPLKGSVFPTLNIFC